MDLGWAEVLDPQLKHNFIIKLTLLITHAIHTLLQIINLHRLHILQHHIQLLSRYGDGGGVTRKPFLQLQGLELLVLGKIQQLHLVDGVSCGKGYDVVLL